MNNKQNNQNKASKQKACSNKNYSKTTDKQNAKNSSRDSQQNRQNND